MQVISEVKEGLRYLWQSVTGGWKRLRQQAAGPLTRFRPGEKHVEVSDDLVEGSPMPIEFVIVVHVIAAGLPAAIPPRWAEV